MKYNYIAILIMAVVTFLIRLLPLTIIRKQIKNRYLQSFFYYLPYVTLALMTFPAILHVTNSPAAAAIALLVGLMIAWFGANLFQVAASCCLVVFVIECFF